MYKAYKFFSDPNRVVTDGNTGNTLLKFDGKGEYVTLDPILAKRMSAHFGNKEIELVEKGEEVSEIQGKEEVKIYKCKHEGCTFETENKGKFAAHSKTHKEG